MVPQDIVRQSVSGGTARRFQLSITSYLSGQGLQRVACSRLLPWRPRAAKHFVHTVEALSRPVHVIAALSQQYKVSAGD
jgi:hypothetical protein